jgi:chromate transport protein ChrA
LIERIGMGKYILMTKTSPSASRLFLSFLRLGLTAFGGPAMVSYIRELL